MPSSISAWGVVPKKVPNSQPPLSGSFSCTSTIRILSALAVPAPRSSRLLPMRRSSRMLLAMRTRPAPRPCAKLLVARTSRSSTAGCAAHVSLLRYSSIATDVPCASSTRASGRLSTTWIASPPPGNASFSS